MDFLLSTIILIILHIKFVNTNIEIKIRQPNEIFPHICTSAGPACDDCKTPIVCIDLGNGTWDKIPTISCTNTNEYCLKGFCSKGPNPICDGSSNLPFPCTSNGMYPDPFFCDRYHFCIPNPPRRVAAICDYNDTYNPVTTFCEPNLPQKMETKCDYSRGIFPVPLCVSPGQSGPLENPALYYVCKEYYEQLYPFLYKCPAGLVYDNYKCG